MWYDVHSVSNLCSVSDFFPFVFSYTLMVEYMFLYGLWVAGLVASEFSVVPVVSQKWKAYFGLT